jgi:putative SOS response-associated peptidase YedK
MSPLLFAELEEALRELRNTGKAHVPRRNADIFVPDVFPGADVPLFVPEADGSLAATELTWGVPGAGGGQSSGHSKLIFNTRIETALSQARSGRGLWAQPILEGRCLVPVRGFYESWTQPDPDAPTPQKGRRPARRQVRFNLTGYGIFLLACVRTEDRFSVVTTVPNAEVGRVHNRMPLVLGPGESRIWLGPEFASLADRSGIRLDAQVEA